MTKRELRKASGLCGECGTRKMVVGRASCVRCLKQSATRQLKKQRKWQVKGLCRWCGDVSLPGRRVCDPCLQKRRLRQKNRRISVRLVILAAKDKGCVDCGTKLPPEVMQLDHVRGTKKLEFRDNSKWRMKAVLTELKKCKVRCPNCHAMRHYNERKKYKR
jgi:uncharacterized OB-fold protein